MPSSDINVENIKQQKCQSCTDFTINLWEEHSSRNGDGEDSCVYHEFIINNRWVRGVLKIRSLCLCLPFFTQELKIITIHGWSKIDNNACIKCARCHQFLVWGYQGKNQRCEPRPETRFQLSQFCLWHWQQFQLFFCWEAHDGDLLTYQRTSGTRARGAIQARETWRDIEYWIY